ncbi:hypothetical protein HTZ77_20890 [Nonomuraea sp. SMC257]|uniref:Uncharacterized protein n=1 Tax=Nonomuraea montanisoli TaxID=2741721 RepID=A0A7Y6I8W9_9ACTN|nr:hypothetical protein [Nonomuraea montanisoli]NUW33870.1 hypothetical protein [Nonomuraea montanisoli]
MKIEGDKDPVDHRLDAYRGRVARLTKDGKPMGFLHITVERWGEVKGLFWRRRLVNGRELPHWHVATRKEDGSWEHEDTISFAMTPEELDQELAELESGYFDGRQGRLRMEWLNGEEAKSALSEHFHG